VLLAATAIILVFDYQQSRGADSAATTKADTAHYIFELAEDESAQQDSLNADSVNKERLRQRIIDRNAQSVDTAQLDAAINAVISQNADITFGVSVKDLSTGLMYNYGNEEPMTAASVTKVLTAVYYLHQVELGNRSLDTVMANGYTAQYNIEQMIVVSNNDTWHTLNDNLGYANMQNYAHSIGLTSYSYADNTISSVHTAQLFADLYERKLINEANTQLLLSYMERANYRDLIIPAVPPHDTVYHKAGEYLVNLNDAAIITNGTKTIVLSIYTESTLYYDKPRVSALMQQITAPTITVFHLD